MTNFKSEILSFGKTLALVAVTIVFAAMQLDDKLHRFENKFDVMTASITELNTTMKQLSGKIDDGEKRFHKVEQDIKEIKAHIGLK